MIKAGKAHPASFGVRNDAERLWSPSRGRGGRFLKKRSDARQQNTYVATTGFFELAVSVPTRKAALESWGAGRDLLQGGYAKEASDPAFIKATMAKPGAVLKRAVGARGGFREHAELPDVSSWKNLSRSP